MFRVVDGTNCPSADVSTVEPSTQHSLLLNKGLIRMTLPVPVNAEFLISINDPYQCPGNYDGSTRTLSTATSLHQPAISQWDHVGRTGA